MASSNKAFEAAARDVSVFPRQIYDCCTAINFKSVFIPVTFIGIIADILYPVKNTLMNTQIQCSTFFFSFQNCLQADALLSVSSCQGRIFTSCKENRRKMI